ncbi:GFA family protein [Marinobacter sp. R17]|uniref:GFA family protein n=1 Tax=Marinobacter sp. R17 TaxID=2484250 RepID=UPI000F4C3D77|nr:GFA family protein [Marinobacter sp. R17]ROT98812.1 GFA family protein [Marinobacter sp. R17]
MMTGQCLCGGIQYEYAGRLGPIALCHCSQCRRAQGSAFAANSPVQKVHFRVTRGDELVKEFESRPGKYRAFCRECGSPLYSRVDAIPGILRLRVGTLDGPVNQSPAYHVYVGSKADWYTITDDLPQYEKTERTNDPH